MTLFYLYYLTKNLTYHIKKICFLVINILKPEKKSIQEKLFLHLKFQMTQLIELIMLQFFDNKTHTSVTKLIEQLKSMFIFNIFYFCITLFAFSMICSTKNKKYIKSNSNKFEKVGKNYFNCCEGHRSWGNFFFNLVYLFTQFIQLPVNFYCLLNFKVTFD